MNSVFPLLQGLRMGPAARLLFLSLMIFCCPLQSEAQNPADITFPSQGHLLRGKFFTGSRGSAGPTIILLPGFPGNGKDALGLSASFSGSGLNVLFFNYSGTHGSEGVFGLDPTLFDVRSAWDYLHQPETIARFHVDTAQLILGGYSYGGGMALTYAASHPEVHRVFSIAGNDHGQFGRDYASIKAMSTQLDSMFEGLKRPNGPINFEGKAVLKKLAANPAPYDLRLAAPKLADRHLFLVGGWDDTNVSIERYLLPFYRALKENKANDVELVAFQTDHTFRNVRSELAAALVGWIQSGSSQEPRRLTGSAVSPAVWGVLEVPRSPGPHPAVVILHGSFGWRPVYAQVARSLADSGFVALAIDYFAETGRDTTRQQRLQMLPRWRATIRGAVEFLRSQPSVVPDRVGLVGYSRGAFLAVSVGSTIPSVKAVVDFYGGIDTTLVSLDDQVQGFPPLLILHGDADTVVPVSRAYQLRQAVVDHKGEVEMHIYPGAHHAFNGAFSPAYSETAALDSFRRTVDFLRRWLSKK